MLKYSRQREAIKNFLRTRKDHPTADMVYTSIREEFPNISLGTVYRNLSLLASLGEIAKISCGDNSDHFDPNTVPHVHFLCEKCGCVEDIDFDLGIDLEQSAQGHFSGEIKGHSLVFHGRCSKCSKFSEESA